MRSNLRTGCVVARASATKLAEQIERLQAEYEQTVAHQHDDLLGAISNVAAVLRHATELKIKLVREALALHQAGNGPERQQIAAAAEMSRNALYYPPYKE